MEIYKIRQQNILAGFLVGIGFIAFIDEVIFHQLLRWHHFYDKSTAAIGLISDGLFHAFSWFATVVGMNLFIQISKRGELSRDNWIGGLLIGIGIFQLYDGIIQHKILKLHQIRYVENVIYYDLVWNSTAFIILCIGIYFFRKGRKHAFNNGTS